jgi:hypothetical protein
MVPTKSMTLLMISMPLMVLAVALAVIPLILMSYADHRRRAMRTGSRSHGSPSESVTEVDTERAPLAA